MPAAFIAAVATNDTNPIIIPDTYDAFYKTEQVSNKWQSPVTVADELSALHSIVPLVTGKMHAEAIINLGCQIVAMSEEICIALGLPYDLNIRLNMMSANGLSDMTLGIARNISFTVGEITLYIQFHILQSPVYNILLGHLLMFYQNLLFRTMATRIKPSPFTI